MIFTRNLVIGLILSGIFLLTGGCKDSNKQNASTSSGSSLKQNVSMDSNENLAPKSTLALKAALESGKATLIFFMNPGGSPCQRQDAILQGMKKKIKNVNFLYVKTSEQSNRNAFYDYGVRSIPLIILADKKGSIAKRFFPGIQSEEILTAELNKIK